MKKTITFCVLACLVANLTLAAAAAPRSLAPVPTALPQGSALSAEQMDNLLAPIALYPDPLLAQVYQDQVSEYAQKLVSSPGQQDGLYWETVADDEPSPLGPLVADARKQGYTVKQKGTTQNVEPFHGYYFKILTRQGSSAPGGAYNYIINGNMIGGFALVAYPANWGKSGVMTFVVNQEGRVYEKNFGARTAEIAGALTEYNPDPTWKLVRE